MKTFLPSLNRKLVAFFTIVLLLLLSSKTNAATINVTSSTTWSALGTTPTAADDIVISNQATLTVNVSNAVCKSITLGNGGSNNNGNLTFNASSQVTISGNIIFAPIGNRTNTLTMTAGGNLICQGITINEPSSSFVSGAGTVTLTANNTLPTTIFTTFNNLSITGGTTTIGVGTTVSGNLVVGTGAAFATTGTLTLGVTGTTSITGTFTLAGTGNKSFTGDVTLNSGAVWNETGVSAYSFAGTFANSATTFTANTGVHTFSGATKAFNGSTTTSIPSVAVTGTYTNNGTLTVGTALSGAGTLANASVLNTSGTVSTTTLSNSGTMNHSGSGTITTALANFTNTGTLNISGSGTITGITNNAAGIVNHSGSSTITSFNNATSTSTLTISTTPTVPTITTLTVTAAGNTVNYTGSGNQTVINAAYKNLGLSGSGVKTLSGTVTIATNLSISGTATASLNTGTTYTVGTLKLGGYGKNSGTWGSTSSAASNQTNTYFAATTGIVSVTTDSRPVVTVTASAQSKTYGGTAPTSGTLGTNFTVSGLILGDTASGATLGYSGSPAGNLATANVGGYTITPSALTLSPGSTSNYNISYSTGTLTVNGASLTITANNGSKTYGQTFTVGAGSAAFTSSALQNGETIGTITIASTGAVNTAVVGSYAIVPSAATGGTFTASNYSITYTNGTLTVGQASLTITATNGSKTYGQTYTVGSGSAAFTSSALQNGETIGTITIASTGAVNTAAVGSYTIVPSAATGGTFTASNYSITYTNGTLTVGQASLTVTANNGTKVYGVTQATPVTGATTFGSTGLQNGETIGSVTLTYGSGAIAATDAVGSTSTITPSAATGGTFVASNYSISYTSNSGTLTVTVAPLTITAINGSKTYGQTYTVGSGSTAFTPTGLQNGETIGSITIASTGAVNTAAVGSYNIVPSAATGGTFTASNYSITYTNGTLTVGQASLTITANNGTKVYGTTQSTPVIGATTFGSTGLQNGETIGSVTLTYGSGALAATDAVGSTSTITPSAATGGTFTAGNYSISYTPNSGTLTVTAASLTITANNGTKVYGTTQATPLTGATTFGSTGLQNGETIGSVTLIYGSGAIAATDAVGSTSTITPSAATGGTFTASNYNIIYASNSGTLTVTAAPLTITADDVSKCFGTTYTLGTTAFGSTGLKNSETIDSVTLNSSGAISSASVGSYTIVPSAATGGTFTASNYSITYVNGTLTVNALPTAPTGTDGATCSTGTVNLSATVGGGETVDWYDAATGGTLLLSGSTAYTTPSISSTTLYYAEARNATTGCVSATRTTVTATVDPTSVGGAVSSDQTICSGTQPANLTLAGNTGSVVKWQSSSDVGFSSPTDISNTSTTLLGTTIGNLTASTYFRAVVQSGVCSTANSTPVLITVDAVSVGGTVSSAQTICYGTEPSNLTLTGYTGSVVKWQSSSDAGFSSPSDITETSTTLDGSTIGSLTANTYFRAVVQNGVCSTANSASVLITVSPTSVGGTVSSIQTICSGSQPADLTLSGQTGSVIKWESSLDAGFSSPTDIIVTSTTLTGATIGALTQDTYFRAVVQSGACDFIESASVLITVSASSAGGAVTGGTAICAGSTSGLLTLSGYTGSIVRWEYSVGPSFSSWTTIANTINTYTSGALTQTTQFRAVVQSGACAEVASTPTSVDINKATYSGGAWDNIVGPDATMAAVIADTYTSAGYNITACSLTVTNAATVVISSNDTVTLSGPLVATGAFVTFNNNANLIQTGSAIANSGAIIIKRNSAFLKRQDYSLWSSPVANQQLQAFSPGTLSNRFYTYNTNTNIYNTVPSPSTTNFATTKGYLIRVPNNHSTTGAIWPGQFTGVPNNGNYSYALENYGSGQRFNLVGNPYPSPIDAASFVLDTNNSANITGTLYFWRKTNNPLNTTPGYATPSYSDWTYGVGYNNPNLEAPEALFFDDEVIQTGQGFIVEATPTGATLNFTNAMRADNHKDQIFRTTNVTNSTNTTIERNRIWLKATNAVTANYSQTLLGYVTNATLGVDKFIDGKYNNDGDIAIASLIDGATYSIQGRPLPFDAADVVPLSFKVVLAENYTIAIDHVDGLFSSGQAIYLRDNLTGTIHDLTTGGYTFASAAGTFDTRFELLYQLPLGVTNPVFNANQVVIYKNPSNDFVINTGNAIMASVKVFDIRGRILQEKKNINANQTTINAGLANEVLLVQITSEEGVVVTKKVIR